MRRTSEVIELSDAPDIAPTRRRATKKKAQPSLIKKIHKRREHPIVSKNAAVTVSDEPSHPLHDLVRKSTSDRNNIRRFAARKSAASQTNTKNLNLIKTIQETRTKIDLIISTFKKIERQQKTLAITRTAIEPTAGSQHDPMIRLTSTTLSSLHTLIETMDAPLKECNKNFEMITAVLNEQHEEFVKLEEAWLTSELELLNTLCWMTRAGQSTWQRTSIVLPQHTIGQSPFAGEVPYTKHMKGSLL